MKKIDSKVASVQALTFHALPSSRPTRIAKAVRVGKCHVFLGENGAIYSTQVNASPAFYVRGTLDATLTGCIRLGLLSKAAVAEHVAAEKARELTRSNEWAAEAFVENAKKLGIALTASQQRIARHALKVAE